MSPVAVARGVAVILWALALHNTLACRGLFWDGSSFLVNLLEHGHFHLHNDAHIFFVSPSTLSVP